MCDVPLGTLRPRDQRRGGEQDFEGQQLRDISDAEGGESEGLYSAGSNAVCPQEDDQRALKEDREGEEDVEEMFTRLLEESVEDTLGG